MKKTLVCFAVMLSSSITYAGPYEDCVLSGMKGVSSDAAARAVNQACRAKINEARKAKQETYGSAMRDDEYSFSEDKYVGTHDDGFVSETFKNKSSYKTVTYVALMVMDGDYYKYKKSDYLDFEGEAAWQKERSQTYYYKLSLKPNAEIKLLYRKPRTKPWFSNVVTVLGRESKWSDAMSPSAWGGDVVKPESKDPLE